jgi:hypothetical protein
MKHVVLVGLDPATVNFADPALPPGMTAGRRLGAVPIREKGISNGFRSAAEAGDRSPNQCHGSEENRGHPKLRVGNTSLDTVLACRIHFDYDKGVKSSGWFLTPGTFRSGPHFAQLEC